MVGSLATADSKVKGAASNRIDSLRLGARNAAVVVGIGVIVFKSDRLAVSEFGGVRLAEAGLERDEVHRGLRELRIGSEGLLVETGGLWEEPIAAKRLRCTQKASGTAVEGFNGSHRRVGHRRHQQFVALIVIEFQVGLGALAQLPIDGNERHTCGIISSEKLDGRLVGGDGFGACETAAQPIMGGCEVAVGGYERLVLAAGFRQLPSRVDGIGQMKANGRRIPQLEGSAEWPNRIRVVASGSKRRAPVLGSVGLRRIESGGADICLRGRANLTVSVECRTETCDRDRAIRIGAGVRDRWADDVPLSQLSGQTD